MKVLIVDNHDQVRSELEQALMSEFGDDVSILVARDGKEGLDLYEQHPDVAVMLLDVMMPGQSGPDLLQKIRKAEEHSARHTRVFMISNAGEPYARKCKDLGIEGWLMKPLNASMVSGFLGDFARKNDLSN